MLHVRGERVDRRRLASALQVLQARQCCCQLLLHTARLNYKRLWLWVLPCAVLLLLCCTSPSSCCIRHIHALLQLPQCLMKCSRTKASPNFKMGVIASTT